MSEEIKQKVHEGVVKAVSKYGSIQLDTVPDTWLNPTKKAQESGAIPKIEKGDSIKTRVLEIEDEFGEKKYKITAVKVLAKGNSKPAVKEPAAIAERKAEFKLTDKERALSYAVGLYCNQKGIDPILVIDTASLFQEFLKNGVDKPQERGQNRAREEADSYERSHWDDEEPPPHKEDELY
jgi:hypothetical protein